MGASTHTAPIETFGQKRVKVLGSFLPKATAAPVVSSGKRFTVARAGIGDFTVTFTDAYPQLVGVQGSCRNADTDDTWMVEFGDYDASAKTIKMYTKFQEAGVDDTFVKADMADDADNEVYFEVTFRNTSINY